MNMKNIASGKKIIKAGEHITNFTIIVKGAVKASYNGGSFVLRNGDIVGLSDLGHRHAVLSYETIEDTSVLEYPYEHGQLVEFINNNPDIHKFLTASLFRQVNFIADQYVFLKNEYDLLKEYLVSQYEEYVQLCEELSISPQELAEYEEVINTEWEDLLPDWITGYYRSFDQVISSSKEKFDNNDFLIGLLVKSGQDITSMVNSCNDIESNKLYITYLFLNRNKMDLFEIYLALYIKAAKKLGANDDVVGQIYRNLNDILMQVETQGSVEPELLDKRNKEFAEAAQRAAEDTNNLEAQADSLGEEQIENVRDSLKKILGYADLNKDLVKSFTEHVETYKGTVNKNGSEDDIRRLRQQIAKEFNEIYIAIFKESTKNSYIPPLVSMFLNFGYVDEDLIGLENAVYLYNLSGNLPTAPNGGVYSVYQWLMAIYNGDKDPGRNEFDIDYTDYLHEQMRNKKITKEEEISLFNDKLARVSYELDNVFPVVNRVTTGRITTFCPLLSEHNILKSLEDMLVKASAVEKSLEMIRERDFGAYYRQTYFTAPEKGITKELIDVEILPDIILFPNIGNRGIMWQEIEGKRRTTPARMFLSIFQQEDLDQQLITLTAQFRWEMCKRVQGARWNDVTERSLTSEYCDYIQYYRKNNELSVEAKEKIKSDLLRCKNSFREVFVRDYTTWIRYESQGSPRLNKVVRGIFITYIPFSVELRNNLKANPMYKEMMERYEFRQRAAIRRLDNLEKKILNSQNTLPDEIVKQMEFLKS